MLNREFDTSLGAESLTAFSFFSWLERRGREAICESTGSFLSLVLLGRGWKGLKGAGRSPPPSASWPENTIITAWSGESGHLQSTRTPYSLCSWPWYRSRKGSLQEGAHVFCCSHIWLRLFCHASLHRHGLYLACFAGRKRLRER